MEDKIEKIRHSMNCFANKLSWYEVTRDDQYLKDTREWLEILNTYMNTLVEQNSETCQVAN